MALSPVWTEAAGTDAAGPSRGVARACRASAVDFFFTFEVLCGASCGD
jgi:hypothetical protein